MMTLKQAATESNVKAGDKLFHLFIAVYEVEQILDQMVTHIRCDEDANLASIKQNVTGLKVNDQLVAHATRFFIVRLKNHV